MKNHLAKENNCLNRRIIFFDFEWAECEEVASILSCRYQIQSSRTKFVEAEKRTLKQLETKIQAYTKNPSETPTNLNAANHAEYSVP